MQQAYLFDKPDFNIVPLLKSAMRESLRECPLSRDQVAAEMSGMIDSAGLRFPGNSRSISKPILDKWVGESSAHVIPLSLLPIFCAVVETRLPLQIVCAPLRLVVITEEDGKVFLWGRAEIEKRRAIRRARKLAEEIEL